MGRTDRHAPIRSDLNSSVEVVCVYDNIIIVGLKISAVEHADLPPGILETTLTVSPKNPALVVPVPFSLPPFASVNMKPSKLSNVR
jgi:hypothetical protein